MATSDVSKAVYEAAKAGETDTVKELCENRSREVVEEIVNWHTEGATPLIMAALHGRTDMVRYLVETCCADVELKGSAVLLSPPVVLIHKGSPLYYAAAEGHLDIVKILVQNSVEVDSRADTLSSPLRIACIHGHQEVIKFLVENGSDVNQTNEDQDTPLHAAAWFNRDQILKYLIEKGARITLDKNGMH